MDENNQRRRRDEPPYLASGPRSNDIPGLSREFSTPSSSDRFRPPALMSTPSSSRVSGGTTTYPTYYQEPTSSFPGGLPATPQQYQSNYPQDQRQQQGFSGYNPDLMYNPSSQAAQAGVYDSAQQFQARQPTSMQMLPEVPGQFFQNEPTSASSGPGLQHHASSSSSIYQQQQSPTSRSLQQGYSGSIPMGGVSQSPPEATAQEGPQPPSAEVNAEYALFQTTLREVFQNIVNGRLAEASQSLLGASEWLLGHVEDLGKCSVLVLEVYF